MSIKHAAIIPLIGGEVLGSQEAFGEEPRWFATFGAFKPNERHLNAYYDNRIPYHVLDEGDEFPKEEVDVISTVCPCAGLSMMNTDFGAHRESNQWMIKTTKLILEDVRPRVFWGENAPLFSADVGKPIRDQMYGIAGANGYTMSVYRTQSQLHGIPQVRNRSFYFFWRDSMPPVFDFIRRPLKPLEELMDETAKVNSMQWPINPRKPSEHQYYRMLEDLGYVESKESFHEKLDRSVRLFRYFQMKGGTLLEAADWFRKNGYERDALKNERRHNKREESGGGFMDRSPVMMKRVVQAYVGYIPRNFIHYKEDRYVTHREGMALMGLPNDFMLLEDDKGNITHNHVCQNVPVGTARDMGGQIQKYLGGSLTAATSDYVFQSNVRQTVDRFVVDDDERSLEEFF